MIILWIFILFIVYTTVDVGERFLRCWIQNIPAVSREFAEMWYVHESSKNERFLRRGMWWLMGENARIKGRTALLWKLNFTMWTIWQQWSSNLSRTGVLLWASGKETHLIKGYEASSSWSPRAYKYQLPPYASFELHTVLVILWCLLLIHYSTTAIDHTP